MQSPELQAALALLQALWNKDYEVFFPFARFDDAFQQQLAELAMLWVGRHIDRSATLISQHPEQDNHNHHRSHSNSDTYKRVRKVTPGHQSVCSCFVTPGCLSISLDFFFGCTGHMGGAAVPRLVTVSGASGGGGGRGGTVSRAERAAEGLRSAAATACRCAAGAA